MFRRLEYLKQVVLELCNIFLKIEVARFCDTRDEGPISLAVNLIVHRLLIVVYVCVFVNKEDFKGRY